MGTRGIVAVVDGSSWRGFYLQLDAYPEGLGQQLLDALRTHGVTKTAQRIRDAQLVSDGRERATPATFGRNGDLAWFYLLDEAHGVLRVFSGGVTASPNAPAGFEHCVWREVATIATASLPQKLKVERPPPWTQLAVLSGWDADDRAAAMRLDVRRRVARDAKSVDAVHQSFERLLVDAFTKAPWKKPLGAQLFITREWTKSSAWLVVRLGGIAVHYAADEWGRHDSGKLELFQPPNEYAEVNCTREALFGVEPALIDLLTSAFPSRHTLFAVRDFLRSRQVPDDRGEEAERLALPAQLADDWRVFTHADGRVWSIRKSATGFQLRLGAPDDDPVFKDRSGDLSAVIAEQLADGFIESKEGTQR